MNKEAALASVGLQGHEDHATVARVYGERLAVVQGQLVLARYRTCVEVLGGSVAMRRQDCDDTARESDQMCLDELRECRASCE